jgi:hypothetical protein
MFVNASAKAGVIERTVCILMMRIGLLTTFDVRFHFKYRCPLFVRYRQHRKSIAAPQQLKVIECLFAACLELCERDCSAQAAFQSDINHVPPWRFG